MKKKINKAQVQPVVMRFWLSWYQPGDDYRPLTFPPNAAILGWWCSGETMESPPRSTLVVLVNAKNEEQAKMAIWIDWPEAEDWRFCNKVDDKYIPNDRFPLSDWMIERVGA